VSIGNKLINYQLSHWRRIRSIVPEFDGMLYVRECLAHKELVNDSVDACILKARYKSLFRENIQFEQPTVFYHLHSLFVVHEVARVQPSVEPLERFRILVIERYGPCACFHEIAGKTSSEVCRLIAQETSVDSEFNSVGSDFNVNDRVI